MDGYVNIGINLLDQDNIGFMITERAKREDYIDALVDFIIKKKTFVDKVLSKYKEKAPDDWVSRVRLNLAACQVFIAYSIFMHVDKTHFTLKKQYADSFIEKLGVILESGSDEVLEFMDEINTFPETLLDVFKFYSEILSGSLMYDYSCMIKRFFFLLNYDYMKQFIESPTKEDLDMLDIYKFGWDDVLIEESQDDLVNLLNDLAVCIEEFMACPFDLCKDNNVKPEYELIGNMFRWQRIASEVVTAIKSAYDKVTVYNGYNQLFETGWDTFDSLAKTMTTGLEKALKVAEQHNLWVSRQELKAHVAHFAIYDSYGDLYISLTIDSEDRPFMLFHPFEKKRKKFIVNALVVLSYRPDLYAYEKMEYAFGEATTKIIRDKI